jgi:hypothetical protein
VGEDSLDLSIELAVWHLDCSAASAAAQADIGTYAHDNPPVAAARMWLSHHNNIVELQLKHKRLPNAVSTATSITFILNVYRSEQGYLSCCSS